MMRAGVGASTNRDPNQAGRAAVRAALKNAGLTECDFVLLFATVGYDQAALVASTKRAAGDALVSGCSGAGVFALGQRYESSHAVAAMACRSDEIRFDHALATDVDADPDAAAVQLLRSLSSRSDDARALFVFMDGASTVNWRFVEALGTELAGSVRIVGGLATDSGPMTRSFQYHGDRVLSGGVSAFLVSGGLGVSTCATWACSPVGRELRVTLAEGRRIDAIDGAPALDTFTSYLGASAYDTATPPFALALGVVGPDGSVVSVRSIRRVVADRRAIELSSPIEQGARIVIVRRDADHVARDADALVRQLGTNGGRPPALVIQIESVARATGLLAAETERRRQSDLQRALGPEAPWIGFLSAGEVTPNDGNSIVLVNSTTVSMIS